MTSHDDAEAINFDKIEKQFMAAAEADAKYWRENEAKIQAVRNKVGSYEEFKDLVLAAHLKPLDKGEKVTLTFNQPWNSLADKSRSHDESLDNQQIKQDSNHLPKNGQEFVRDWRRYYKTTEERCAFLLYIGHKKLGDIFKTEISCGLLGDFIGALLDAPESESEEVIAILNSLSKVNRFSLSILFLNSNEKEKCAKLFTQVYKRIQVKATSEADDNLQLIKELTNIYEVKVDLTKEHNM